MNLKALFRPTVSKQAQIGTMIASCSDLYEKFATLVECTKTDAWKQVLTVLDHIDGLLVEQRRDMSDRLLDSGKAIGEKDRRFLDAIRAQRELIAQLRNAGTVFGKHRTRLRDVVRKLMNKADA